jgi:hypothetical protein
LCSGCQDDILAEAEADHVFDAKETAEQGVQDD